MLTRNKKLASKSKPKSSKKKIQVKEPPKLFRHKTIDGKKSKLYLLETNTHLRSIVEYQEDGKPAVGAILLNTGSLKEPKYRIRFVLACPGYHDYQNPLQAEASISGISALLREIPQAESFRIYYDCFPDSIDREVELTETFHRMYENSSMETPAEIQSKILIEEITTLREGHRLKRRRQQCLHIAVTYTAKNEGRKKDELEKAIEYLLSLPKQMTGKISGSAKLLAQENLDRFLLRAYQAGYKSWAVLLQERLGMTCVPLDGEGVWQFCRLDSNRYYDRDRKVQDLNYQPPTVPHLVRYNLSKQSITEVSNSRLHSTSIIFQEPTSIPATGRDYVFVDGKYIGCLYLKTQPSSFDETSKRTLSEVQLFYLWDILSKRFGHDLRVVLELTTVEDIGVALNNEDLIKQSHNQLKDAESKGRIDVRAQIRLDEAIEVQKGLVGGDPTLDFALAIYIHRDSLTEMRATANELRQYFRAPSCMLQDVDTADSVWIQGLPIYGKSLLVDLRDRRDRTHAAVLASYMPLLIPQSPHQGGLEFIAIKGGTPIYFDPFHPKKQGHIAVWGQTRSGKSLLVGWIIVRGLIEGVKITICDRPPSGEASTFKDFTSRLNGAYIDVYVDALNPFELPNIPVDSTAAHADDLKKESRSYLLRFMNALVLGDISDSDPFTKRIEGFLEVILATFFENQQIQLRYVRAIEGGIGSDAWQQYPILEDYIEFCDVSIIGLTDASVEDIEAMSFIRNQLRKWTMGQYSQVLNAPSKFEIDRSSLLTIAMRGGGGKDEEAVFGSLLYLVAMRRAIAASASPKGSLLFIDEAASAVKITPICNAISVAMVNGLKARMRVCLASQEPGSIANSVRGEQIMDALTYQLIGRIGNESLAAYDKYLNLPRELALMNASDDFAPDTATFSSRWLFKFNDRFTAVTAYLPPSLVALTANNIEERQERQKAELQNLLTSQLEEQVQ
jgi:hypothetical protein